MKITLSGEAGSGKSTVAKRLAEVLKYPYFSGGIIQRRLAQERGVSLLELHRYEEKDSSFDNKVDEELANVGKIHKNLVLDAWLGFHFVPDSLKIFLTVDKKIAAQRIFDAKRYDESYPSPAVAYKALMQREESNRKRWIEFYGVDFMDRKHYSFVIDTTQTQSDEVVEKILNLIHSSKNPLKKS